MEREVYAGRAAETCGISREAMLLDVKKAYGKRKGAERQAMKKENLGIDALYQPKDRSIRYDDMRSAMAEEGLLRLLFLDTSLAEKCGNLTERDFSAPLLGKIYKLLVDAWHHYGSPLSPAAMQEFLNTEEMSHLTFLLQKPESLAEADRSLPDYINIIQDSALRRRGTLNEDPLAAAMDKSKDKKGYGGKHNG